MKSITKQEAEYVRKYLGETQKRWNKIFNSDEFVDERCELLALARNRELNYNTFKEDEFENFVKAFRGEGISSSFAMGQLTSSDDTNITISMTCHDKSKGKRKKRYIPYSQNTALVKKILAEYNEKYVKIIYDSDFPEKYENKNNK